MRVLTAIPLTLFVLLTVALGVGTVATPVAAQDSPDEFDDHESVILVELTDGGNAEWTAVQYIYLEDDEDVDRFEVFAEQLRTGQRDAGYDRQTFEAMIPHAEERTDREMSIENAGWEQAEVVPVEESDAFADADLENGSVGTLAYSFTWTNFADHSDDRLSLQDVFLTEDGEPWLESIFAGQRFVIEAPSNHDFVTAPHGIDDGTLSWNGPHVFDADDFNIVLEDRSTLLDSALNSWLSLLGGLVLLVALVGGVVWYLLVYRDDFPAPFGPGSGDGPRREPEVTAETAATGPSPSDAAGADDDPSTEDGDSEDDIDVELLSDEERVHRLLNQNGGRMKQGTIVKETGWSNAKVSQLLSKMHEDGEIEKLRIGRENLITLPEIDPTKIE